MSGKTLEIEQLLGRDNLATALSNRYYSWQQRRESWLVEKDELRDYIFATDTRKTANKNLPWKNSTTIPKLCQIRDNLLANYMTALFPNDNWLRWEAYSNEDNTLKKKKAITSYTLNKLRESGFIEEASKLLDDYVTYGNFFVEVQFVKETKLDVDTGEKIPGYVGPKIVRRSPYDIVFNPLAPSFEESPKFTRYIKTMGELKVDMEKYPEEVYNKDIIEYAEEFRKTVAQYDSQDVHKAVGFMIDGFSDMKTYYESGYVEILKFEGNVHNQFTGELMKDQEIIIIDRSYIVSQRTITNWSNRSRLFHGGWRDRPDNLYAMGPLDNLVGMQYRIDHLENLKADVFDVIGNPVLKIKGNVDEFNWHPGAEIFLGDDGDVEMLTPDPTALNADNQVAILEDKMENMAGAPRQAMGIRTPGEKTAFEVQSLENASSRIFQNKIMKFESVMEKVLNEFLEIGRHNLEGTDIIRVMDDDLGVADFLTITREDITAKGHIRPVGAKHFAARAQLSQNLVGLLGGPIGPMVVPHLSSKKLALLVEDLFELSRYDLFRDNIGVVEQAETAKIVNQLQQDIDVNDATPLEEEEAESGGEQEG